MTSAGSFEPTADPALVAVLEQAREFGFLGPGPIGPQFAHALGFARAAGDRLGGAPSRFLDLGSGGGLPGLVLAQCWPEAEGVLLDANHRRCEALATAVETLGLADRVAVLEGRGEALGRDPALRQAFSLVTARSFGPAAVTAEVGGAFLEAGGCLVVSEPPGGAPERWDTDGLAELGLGPAEQLALPSGTYAAIAREQVLSDRYPRRVGIPAKRPLWPDVSRETSG